ncbi:MAG: helix-turn-helix transcriptional regulator [Nitrospiraceae bacterium]|nr:helix-turn-helix transcriptional regulator [Nitrospiraceae bacterium]
MENTRKLLGARIKELRRARGFSQMQLAEKVDIDFKHLSRIEVGNSYPSMDTLEKITEMLGCELKDFFEFAPPKQNPKREIIALLNEADPEKLNLIYKIMRAIIR